MGIIKDLSDFIDLIKIPEKEKREFKAAVSGQKGGWDLSKPVDSVFFMLTEENLKELGIGKMRIRHCILDALRQLKSKVNLVDKEDLSDEGSGILKDTADFASKIHVELRDAWIVYHVYMTLLKSKRETSCLCSRHQHEHVLAIKMLPKNPTAHMYRLHAAHSALIIANLIAGELRVSPGLNTISLSAEIVDCQNKEKLADLIGKHDVESYLRKMMASKFFDASDDDYD